MAGIAGMAAGGERGRIESMLEKMVHRGPAGRAVVERGRTTLGVVWTDLPTDAAAILHQRHAAVDETENSSFARAEAEDGRLALVRDPLGVAPLYYGTTPMDRSASLPR